ncbi:MAG TPA: nucleoside-diphosphate kinase [Flavobacteriales bacterium]|nr:nucleoside-diphosphate kinase [Flavobacteriales bacterium]
MTGNKTLAMIKPEAVAEGNIGAILDMMSKGGFKIKALKLLQLSEERAKAFYAVHAERPFYHDLVNYMTSGPIIATVLEKDNAVQAFRDFIGATNPAEAAEGTIRAIYGRSLESNAVHGSDSDENAVIETEFHFSADEIV